MCIKGICTGNLERTKIHGNTSSKGAADQIGVVRVHLARRFASERDVKYCYADQPWSRQIAGLCPCGETTFQFIRVRMKSRDHDGISQWVSFLFWIQKIVSRIKIYRSNTHPKSHSPHNDATACSGHEWRFRRGKYVNHFGLTLDACMLRLTSPRICCGDLSRVPALLTRHARCALPCYRIIRRLYNAVDTIIRVGIAGTAISRILSSQKRRQLPLPVKRHEQVYVADVAAM